MKKIFLTLSIASFGIAISLLLPVTQAQTTSTSFTDKSPSDFCTGKQVYSSVSVTGEKVGNTYQYCSDPGECPFPLEVERTAYHRYLNERFENNIQKIKELVDQSKKESLLSIQEIIQKDPTLNTGSFSIELLCSFEKYSRFVRENMGRYTPVANSGLTASDTGDQLIKADLQNSAWINEIEYSRAALDESIAAYDQVFTTFYLHQRYIAVTQKLVLFQSQLAKLTQLVSCLPSKFVNASTSQCQ